MKYSESNKPLVCMHTESRCYTNSYDMTVLGVLWHSTGANNPTLKRYVQPSSNDPNRAKLLELIGKNPYGNHYNRQGLSVGVNAWIGKLADGSVTSVQTLPWNMRPWGCGGGSRGSCNSGWIQFEICEDNLKNKTYFDAIYKEACELTAYWCKLYNLNPLGTVNFGGQNVPVILCHADSHDLGLGSNHGDVLHWFKYYGKTMDDVRRDVAALMNETVSKPVAPSTPTPAPTTNEIYRIRKTWADSKSQVGAYRNLTNAKAACDKAGKAYSIFNSSGKKVYPVEPAPTQNTQSNSRPVFSRGSTGAAVVELQTKLKELGFDCKGIDGNFGGNTLAALVSFQKERGLEPDGVCGPATWKELYAFAPYKVIVNVAVLNIRYGPSSTQYKIKGCLTRNAQHTIVYKKGDWGKLRDGLGWIHLGYVKKV